MARWLADAAVFRDERGEDAGEDEGEEAAIGCMGGVRGTYEAMAAKAAALSTGEHAAGTEANKGRASFFKQTDALVRKNLTFQLRNWGTNLALILTPILFLGMLVLLQFVVNRQLDTPSNKCGCECLRCCAYEQVADAATNTLSWQRVCFDSSDDPDGRLCSPYDACEKYNETNCGLQYSTSDQSIFCPIERPLAWPSLMQLPDDAYRPPNPPPGSADVGDDGEVTAVSPLLWPGNATPMMFTGGDRTVAAYLAEGLLARRQTLEEALGELIVAMLTAQAVFPQSDQSNDFLGSFVGGGGGNATAATTRESPPQTAVERAAAYREKQREQDRRQRLLTTILASAQGGGGVGEFLGAALFSSDDANGTAPSMPTQAELDAIQGVARAFQNLDLRYATAAPASFSLYLEPAFLPSADQGAISKLGGEGGGMGGGGTDPNEAVVGAASSARASASAFEAEMQAMLEPRPLWYAFVDCSDLPTSATSAMEMASNALASNLGIRLQCTSTPDVWMASPDDIDEAIYCGWRSAECDGEFNRTATQAPNLRGIAQYGSTQFDFGRTSLEPMAASAARAAVVGGKSQVYDMSLWYNSSQLASSTRPDGGPGAVPKLDRINSPINLAANAALRALWPPSLSENAPRASLRGLKDTPKPSSQLLIEFSTLIGPIFYLWLLNLMLPVNVYALVYEKGNRLRVMMKMGGLSDATYYFVSYAYMWVVYTVYAILFVITGAYIFQLPYFKNNDIGIQIVFYMLYGHVLTAMSFLFSCFFSNARTSLVMMLLFVFISGLVANVAIQEIVASTVRGVWAIQIFPPFALYRGLWEFGQYGLLAPQIGGRGMTWSSLVDDADNGILLMIYILLVEWVVLTCSAFYLDQVTDSGAGMRKHPLWFLRTEDGLGWRGCGCRAMRVSADDATPATAIEMASTSGRPSSAASDRQTSSGENTNGVAEDVAHEAERVAQCVRTLSSVNTSRVMTRPDAPAVALLQLRKQYPRKLAVKDVSIAIGRTECFGLLGPNGAGKSTTLNVLTGLTPPTSGAAYVCGMRLNGATMDAVYARIGVCPQHDLLWGQLTAREHVLFYARLKNLSGPSLRAEVKRSLTSVALWDVADVPCGKFSGGMRRRLSVAIALVGSPSVVFLDEPSTGLDPGSRRLLWDVVLEAKKKSAVVLTTHSMEEAEVLSDRIGIVVGGSLQCVGEPRALAARFAGYLVVSVTAETADADAEDGHRAFHEAWLARLQGALGDSAGVDLVYALGGALRFEVSGVSVASLFALFERHGASWRVSDWGVSSATLDDVFVKVSVAAGAGVEA